MSTVELAARQLKSVKDEEWRTLAALERVAAGHGAADVGRLSRTGMMPRERAKFAMDSLAKKGLASRKGQGLALTRQGVELMALKDYVKKDLISALGAIIARGKESDVYEAITEEGTVYALKLYKIGRTSFTRVRKTRRIEPGEIRSWMAANYGAARREYLSLRKLEGLSPSFPRAIAYSRSTVLLEEVSGVRLSQRPDLEDPSEASSKIFDAMRVAYTKAGLVNADLSEYNVLTDGKSVWLIDWPQAVEAGHPNSLELLKHDVSAVSSFFRRAYGNERDEARTLEYVLGRAAELE